MSNEREIEKKIVKFSVNRRKQTYLYGKMKENCANWELSHVFLSEKKWELGKSYYLFSSI